MSHREDRHLLEVRNVSKNFGGLLAVDDVSFSVRPGEFVSIIGPNGAGKTTLLNLIAGTFPPSRGDVRFNGQSLRGLPPHKVCSLGIARTFQSRALFTNLSVVENVMVGLGNRGTAGLFEIMAGLRRARRNEKEIEQRAMEVLAGVGLGEKAHAHPLSLTVKEQQLLAMARALATGPELLLLDEPAGGLSVDEMYELADYILALPRKGVGILLVDHRMEMVMGFSERVIVLSFGRKIADDVPAQVQSNREVITAYLGEGWA